MPTLEITINVKEDGVVKPGFPRTRRISADELQSFRYEKATGGGYVAVPTNQLDEVQALIFETDQQVTVRLDGQSDAGIVLNAGGLLIIIDADIDAGSTTNVTVDNSSGSTANLEGLAYGT